MVNVWSEEVVEKAISQWGNSHPPWVRYAFEQASEREKIIDVGCGFGRFWRFLVRNSKVPKMYIGVDGSEWMVRKCNQLYGASEDHVFFVHDAVESFDFIEVPGEFDILCNSVLIHLPFDQQLVVLENIRETQPKKVVLDIESREGVEDVARVNQEMGQPFYRTWNDPEKFEWLFEETFPEHLISVNKFPYGKGLARHVFVATSSDNRTKE